MRLAYLPPSALTNTQPNPVAPYAYQPGTNNSPPTDPGSGNYALDPGVRFPYLDLNFNTGATTPTMPTTPQIPPIPPRRWFQVPDVFAGGGLSSNASLAGDNRINIPNPDQYLAYQNAALAGGNSLVPFETQYVAAPAPANVSGSPPYLTQNYYLGANTTTGANPVFDNRQHPAYRTELLQKVMNLTTVRTHQFAVWITVGFFEVTRVGVPELGRPDVLGGELGLAAGANVRYRSFFVLDRTKATGFNPYFPGEFRDCVTYRRRIE
jgi:hypothetical protein